MKYYNLIRVRDSQQALDLQSFFKIHKHDYRSYTPLPEDFVLLLKLKFTELIFREVVYQ